VERIRPSEDRNRNCTRTGGIPTRKGVKRPDYESKYTDAGSTLFGSIAAEFPYP